MGIKLRLTAMNFMQFFVWGAWLISLGGYLLNTLHFSGGQVGSIYATMGIASLFMPGIAGIIADRWINAERVFGILHFIGAGLLFCAAGIKDANTLYIVLLFNAMVYMPTIALNNTVSYSALQQQGLNIVKDFPPIRVWGTIGFICAMWVVDLAGWNTTPTQFYVSASVALLLGLYAFTMPQCRPAKKEKSKSVVSALGLDAFVLFRRGRMAIFFLFAALLGAALQITNTYGEGFLEDFAGNAKFKGAFAVAHPGLLMSVSQIAETIFILTIPFFLSRFGIKKVMLLSIFAWVFRFALFGLGDPGSHLWMLIMSMIVYGMAFDFFNISGALFVDSEADVTIRASAQGLFMIMTNGLGAFIGGTVSGWVVDHFTKNGVKDWQSIWFSFAAYALLLGIIFPFVFHHKHDPEKMKNVRH